MKPCSILPALFALLAALPLAQASEPDPETVSRVVTELGQHNGTALACGHTDVSARAKSIMIARVPKMRNFGEAFEAATNAAFLARAAARDGCPSRLGLSRELERSAQPLAPPSTHATESEPPAATEANPRYLLQASNGRAVMDSDFRHQFQIITFGYTFCPDVCPTTLTEMAAILKALDKEAPRVQALFFSLDPERDTLAHLRSYTRFFDERILAATGSADLVRHAARNFQVRYEKVVDPASPKHYSIDHSAGMFLLAPGGQFIARFPYGTPVDTIVVRLREEFARRPPVETGKGAP